MSTAAESASGPASRGEIVAWAMYDWANSAYSTLSITILHQYLLRIVFGDPSWGTTGQVVWAWGISASMLIAGALSPVVGAWADAQAAKRRWLGATALLGAAACVGVGVAPLSQPWLVVALFVLAAMSFELSLGFYNAFLPELANERTMNRISAWGFALGYIGGAIALVIAMVIISLGPSIGLPTITDQLRVSVMLMGIWWGVFSLPAIFMLRDRATPRALADGWLATARQSFVDVGRTLRHVRMFPALAIFLLGFLFYNDGVQTVISQASTFATQELAFTTAELAQVILMIQVLAMPGALAIGWLADRWGQKQALYLCLAIWVGLLASAYFITTKPQFWWLAVGVALVLGGIQSVSRAIMGHLTPASRTAEFFGFFNLSGKSTSFMGTFAFGLIIGTTHSARLAIISLIVFVVLGWLIVSRVDLYRGRQQALGAE